MVFITLPPTKNFLKNGEGGEKIHNWGSGEREQFVNIYTNGLITQLFCFWVDFPDVFS